MRGVIVLRQSRLNIVHIFRAPVGGLFRHVVDLAQGQIARGHRVGIIADSVAGNARSSEILDALAPKLALGLTRIPICREPSLSDLATLSRVSALLKQTHADVIHGHGAKGGALARLVPAPRGTVRGYTPHGGSLHDGIGKKLHLLLERLMLNRGNLYLFESEFSHATFLRKVGEPRGTMRVVHNGVSAAEHEPIALADGATDLVFLGELRELKGVDVLIEAIARMHADGRAVTATIVGDGPDKDYFRDLAVAHGLRDAVRFERPMPARAALARGCIMVVPSRAESLPYVVLEAAAAAKPLTATNVGGIPEIFGPQARRLVPPADAAALAQAIAAVMDNPAAAERDARTLRQNIAASFCVEGMVNAVLCAYEHALRAQASPVQLRALAHFEQESLS
ncbi:MAG TPA: glycosyltransferase family 4 protein [Pseudolabrys sp.]